MSFDPSIQRSLRRLKPEKHGKKLAVRRRSSLTFLEDLSSPLPRLLLDTTVYVDELQGRLPRDVEVSLRIAEVWHSAVTEAEMIAVAGLLDASHPGTNQAVHQVVASIERRHAHRILLPDREVWREAGILAGLLARLQHYGQAERQRVLNDALILLSAKRYGCVVLTRNLKDFDLLTQLDASARAVFY